MEIPVAIRLHLFSEQRFTVYICDISLKYDMLFFAFCCGYNLLSNIIPAGWIDFEQMGKCTF